MILCGLMCVPVFGKTFFGIIRAVEERYSFLPPRSLEGIGMASRQNMKKAALTVIEISAAHKMRYGGCIA
jgi:hypothetical protein